MEHLLCCSKLFIINTVLDMVLGSVCGPGEDIENFVVFVVEIATVDFKFSFDARLP